MITRKKKKKVCIMQTLRAIEPGESVSAPLSWNYETMRSARRKLSKEGIVLGIKRTINGYIITRYDYTD